MPLIFGMQFQVPQFIEVEDKIFGPLTLKQFIYLAGGAAGIFVLYALLPLFLAILLAIPVGLFSAALAFYKMHGQPFIKVVENAFGYATKNKIYTWKKREIPVKKSEPPPSAGLAGGAEIPIYVPRLTKSKLSDLAWSLDLKEKK